MKMEYKDGIFYKNGIIYSFRKYSELFYTLHIFCQIFISF